MDDWPDIVISTELQWRSIIEIRGHRGRNLKSMYLMDDEALNTQTLGRTYNLEFLLNGIIQHDIYHLGQIAVLSVKR